MTDTNGIRFDTTNVRGFAEYMHHLLTSKYEEWAATIRTQLAGGADDGSDGRARSSVGGGSMGSSGVAYYGLDIGKAEVENARAGATALDDIVEAWRSMANGAAYAAEAYPGTDGDNASEIDENISPFGNE